MWILFLKARQKTGGFKRSMGGSSDLGQSRQVKTIPCCTEGTEDKTHMTAVLVHDSTQVGPEATSVIFYRRLT